jgi:hypothetical protein
MRLRTAFLALLSVLLSATIPSTPVRAQYMYLDANSNGVHDPGDQVNSAGTTTVDVWLDTDTNRNGTSPTCSSGSQAFSLTGYEFCLKVIGGGVAWGTFTNQRASFTVQFPLFSDSTRYHNGFGGDTPLTAGTYKLATISFTVTSGNPYVALTPFLDDLRTTFLSQCLGLDFDGALKLGQDWHDVDGIRESDSWSHAGIAVAPDSLDQFRPAVAPDGAGGVIVAWEQGLPFSDIFAQKVNAAGARQWGANGVRLCAAANSQIFLQAVPDASGGAIFAWWDQRVSSWHVYCRRVNSVGTPLWTANGVAIETAIDGDPYPTAIADGAGGAIIAWRDRRITGVYHVYAQRVDSTGVVAWTTNGVAVVTASVGQGGAALTTDGAGGAIVAWNDGRTGAPGVYAQRLNSSGVAQWQTDGVLVSAGAAGARLVSDGSGGAIISYGLSGDIYARRISSGGSLQWSSADTVCNATGTQRLNSIASDGAGGAILAWEDSRAGNQDVYAARVRQDGVDPWATNGVSVCTAPNDQFFPASVSDGNGGVVITWEDRRDDAVGDIYMQRLNGNGSALWNHDGTIVAKEEYGQQAPMIASDGAGGAFAAWQDNRNDYDFKVYTMRVKSGGSHVTAVGTAGHVVPTSVLKQNYPNPFNPSTSIEFNLSENGPVALRIYAADGRLVRTLLKGAWPAGPHRVSWDGRTDAGGPTSTGVYFYRLETARTKTAKKMMLIR